MEDQLQLTLGLYEPELEGGICLRQAILRVWATKEKRGPEITLVHKIVPLGEQRVDMAKKTTKKKAAVKKDDEILPLAEYIEGDMVVLEPRLHVKVTDVVPKAFSSCGFDLSIRYMTKPKHMDQSVKAAAIQLNNSVAAIFDDLAEVFGGVSPYGTD